MRSLFYISSLIFIFSLNVSAEEEDNNQVPVIEPITQDINARLDRVEQAIKNQALLDMLDLLESLKVDISTLRGEVELQSHTIEQLKQKQRDLYTDIDGRLQRLETQTANLPAGEVTETTPAEEPTEEVAEAETETEEEKPDPAMAEAEYQRAFNLLKESQYEQALVAFKKFLKDFPDGEFSDNAQYWLGETNYVMQNYEIAINEYQALLNTFPDSQKVSHALLKIGYSYAELGNAADAKKTLNEVKKQYPGTTAARLADERLRKLKSSNESNT